MNRQDMREGLSHTNRCLYCDTPFHEEISWRWAFGLTENQLLCPPCQNKLESITTIGCSMCGRPSVKKTGGSDPKGSAPPEIGFVDPSVRLPNMFVKHPDVLCLDCKRWKDTGIWADHPLQHRALYVYNAHLQEVIARYKYRGDAKLSELFSGKLKKLTRSLGKIDTVTVIPLQEERLWERGFNQAELLAESFPVQHVLERTSSSDKQSKRDRSGRIAALKGAFSLSSAARQTDWQDKRVLIVDDIYTTGATLRAAAEVFYTEGASHVFTVTVARATGKIKREP
ncbi:ComF family protein [Salipaludibacillus aurantiacus]|uniref:Competence protein ComFC n=1 Tax=Salipaludibacillus aurantiacus TaxID=1601833 RepID=A0A1H9W8S3_9BACI|nr:ComF family protein [Salipaludibacillus aurantiacus]SES30298.1 competence protein ComFC [Salipaludibacillus aurantiacus]